MTTVDDPIKKWARALEKANQELFESDWPKTPKRAALFPRAIVFGAAVGRIAESFTRRASALRDDRLEEMSIRVFAATYPTGAAKNAIALEIVTEIADEYRAATQRPASKPTVSNMRHWLVSTLSLRLSAVVDPRFRKLERKAREVIDLFDRYHPSAKGKLGAPRLTERLHHLAGKPLGSWSFSAEALAKAKQRGKRRR